MVDSALLGAFLLFTFKFKEMKKEFKLNRPVTRVVFGNDIEPEARVERHYKMGETLAEAIEDETPNAQQQGVHIIYPLEVDYA